MKTQTALIIQSYKDANQLKFEHTEKGIELEHNLSDEQMRQLVEAEYGSSLTSTVDELFKVIMKNLVKSALEKAKSEA